MRRDRFGEVLEVDDEDADETLGHSCDGGWLGEDHAGRPIPCPTCKGEHIARAKAATRRRLEGPISRRSA